MFLEDLIRNADRTFNLDEGPRATMRLSPAAEEPDHSADLDAINGRGGERHGQIKREAPEQNCPRIEDSEKRREAKPFA